MFQKLPGDLFFKLDNFVETSGAQRLILLAGGAGRRGAGVNCQCVVAARESGIFTLAAGRAELTTQKKARRPVLPKQTASSFVLVHFALM